MLPYGSRRVNLVFALVVISACSEPAATHHGPRPAARQLGVNRRIVDQGGGFSNSIAESIARGHIREDLPPSRVGEIGDPPRLAQPSALSALGPDLEDLEIDMDRGQALADYVDENVDNSRWRRLGVQALTETEIWGDDETPGLCEEGALLQSFEEDGVEYEASYAVASFVQFLDGPTAMMVDLDESCQEALLASAGDLDAVLAAEDCDEFEEHTFFPEGSECRDCLSGAGDFPACVEDGACLEEAPYTQWVQDYTTGEKTWFQTAEADVWACAPDLASTMYVFGNFGSDGTLPAAFDHANWAFFCVAYWDERSDAPVYSCGDGTGGWELGHTVGEGALNRVNYIRPVGSSDEPHYDRLWYAHSMNINRGPTLQYFWSTAPGTAQISMTPPGIRSGDPQLQVESDPIYDSPGSVWNLNPLALRPDGVDPTNIDDTFARDWLSVITLKSATQIDGILIRTMNHNRCLEDAWEGPLEDGSYRCAEIGPGASDWMDDGRTSWTVNIEGPGDQDFGQFTWDPMTTIGTTGLPDPLVPGGATVQLAGTPGLANEDWEGCSWPTTFIPDSTAQETRPGAWAADAPMWGDTWRFGAHPDLDLRVILATNQTRDFCPEEEGFGED